MNVAVRTVSAGVSRDVSAQRLANALRVEKLKMNTSRSKDTAQCATQTQRAAGAVAVTAAAGVTSMMLQRASADPTA